MAEPDRTPTDGLTSGVPLPYAPPSVEAILTPEELEREVLYAGGPSAIN